MTEWNTGTRIRNFLQTPEKPIELDEYFEFWNSLTDEEKVYYRGIELLG